MPNQTKYYDGTTAITTTPATAYDLRGATYTMLEYQNDTDLDVLVVFASADGVAGPTMIMKAGVSKIRAFEHTGLVQLKVAAGSSTGSFTLQSFRG